MSYMILNVPRWVYERRLARMVKLIEMKAPAIIIYHEARLIQSAYQPSRWNRFMHWFRNTRVGLWWTMLGYEEPEIDPEEGLSEAELKEMDLGDPDFFLSLSDEQLVRFIRDVMNADLTELTPEAQAVQDSESRVTCTCLPNQLNIECPVHTE